MKAALGILLMIVFVALVMMLVGYMVYLSMPSRPRTYPFFNLPSSSELPNYAPHLDKATGKLVCNEPQ